MSFDMRHLRYVIAAAEHRSFFQAALALEIEQSTMSRNIVRLERRLGVKLFKRSHAGISPTAAGVEFIRLAQEIVAKADRLTATLLAGEQRRFTVGYQTALLEDPLREMISTWRARFPDIVLNRIEGPREALLAGLDSGAIDVAILAGEVPSAG